MGRRPALPPCTAATVLPPCTHDVRSIERHSCCTLPSSPVWPLVSTLYCHPVLPPLVLPPVLVLYAPIEPPSCRTLHRAPLMLYAPSSHSCHTLHRAPLLLYAPSSTSHAVRHASSRRSRYASCVKLSIDHTPKSPRTIWFDWARCLVPRAKSINYKESCNIFRQPG